MLRCGIISGKVPMKIPLIMHKEHYPRESMLTASLTERRSQLLAYIGV